MFCFVAFAVLAIMGIFSSTHRVLAREAFACIGRRVTFRPCDTGFREKMQGAMVGTLMRRSVRLARFVNKHFEFLAWIFFLLTVWSLWVTAVGVYNFYFYGSCDGLNQSSFCVLDPAGRNTAFSNVDAPEEGVMIPPCDAGVGAGGGLLSQIPLTRERYPRIQTDSVNDLVFIGCFECRYTRQVYPTLQRLRENFNPNITFVHYPIFPNTRDLTAIVQCAYESGTGDEWWQVVDNFFSVPAEALADAEQVEALVAAAGFDVAEIQACAAGDQMQSQVRTMRQEVLHTGLYGTPLVFLNDTAIVGPKPYRVYRFMMR